MAGYVIYDQDNPSEKYYFDKAIGGVAGARVNLAPQSQRTQLDTFGKYPYVYYVGNKNYRSFVLNTVFLAEEDTETDFKCNAKQVADRFVELLNKHKPLIVEGNSMTMLCDVQLTAYNLPLIYDDEFYDFVEIGVTCTEIGDDSLSATTRLLLQEVNYGK